MKTIVQTFQIFLDHILEALSIFFRGKEDKAQYQEAQKMFDRRVEHPHTVQISHNNILFDPRPYPLVQNPSNSQQNEASVPQEVANGFQYLQIRRATRDLRNHKIDQLIIQGCSTQDITLNGEQKEIVKKVTDPTLHKTTLQELIVEEEAAQEFFVEDQWLLDNTPVTPEEVVAIDPDDTMQVPAIMKLKHIGA
jgi:hypothetical protein